MAGAFHLAFACQPCHAAAAFVPFDVLAAVKMASLRER